MNKLKAIVVFIIRDIIPFAETVILTIKKLIEQFKKDTE